MQRVLVFFLLIIPLLVHSQTDDYKFIRYDVRDGLSNNEINCFLKDRRGFLWIGTLTGLNRFDGSAFKNFRFNSDDTTSLRDDFVDYLFEDPDGRIWAYSRTFFSVYDPNTELFSRNPDAIARQYGLPDARLTKFLPSRSGHRFWVYHLEKGLCQYQPDTRQLIGVTPKGEPLDAAPVSDFQEDSRGFLWIVHQNGVLECYDPVSNTLFNKDSQLSQQFKQQSYPYRLFIDRDNDIWFYGIGTRGAFVYYPAEKRLQAINTASSPIRLKNNIVRGIIQDIEGIVWLATDHGGVALVDKEAQTVQYLQNNPENDQSLSQNSVISIYSDSTGIVWVGTYKRGLNVYHKNVFKFPLYRHRTGVPTSLPFNDVNRFAEDAQGNLWIGTNGGGLVYFDRSSGVFSSHRNVAGSEVITSLYIDRDQKLWAGAYFGGLICADGKKITRYSHDNNNANSLGDESVWEIFEDSKGRLWLGLLRNGLDMFDRSSGRFHHFQPRAENSIASAQVTCIIEDKEGNIWFGTEQGIDVLDAHTSRFTHYEYNSNNPNSLSNNSVRAIVEDAGGHIWVATMHGLNLFDKGTRSFRFIGQADGLPDEAIMTMVDGGASGLWMGTPKGLINLKATAWENNALKEIKIRVYDELDGLQGLDFNLFPAFRTRKGEVVFGGTNGFNIINPEEVNQAKNPVKVLLTDFQVFNQHISPGQEINSRQILSQSIMFTRELTLMHSQNVFSIEFAALNFFHPEKNIYYYKLQGFNDKWFQADKNTRKVTYTNLDPGTYYFYAAVKDENGVWTQSEPLTIYIKPPFWRSSLAYLLYFILLCGALIGGQLLLRERDRMNFRLEKERIEARRMHELDMVRIKFFTNLSHELRTPLTLILSPIERLLAQTKDKDTAAQLSLIQRNAKRLLDLVNHLLDFRKLEIEETEFVPYKGDIVPFVRDITQSFSDLTERKHIHLRFETRVSSLVTIFDQEKLSRILYNLLSNAFKFTPAQGAVTVQLDLEEPGFLSLRVIDTGIGMTPEVQQQIFERFYQAGVPEDIQNYGSGIGLSITREFVHLHKGTIRVESTPEKGSSFLIRLPAPEITERTLAAQPTEDTLAINPVNAAPVEPVTDSRQLKVLVVEDNDDFREYLRSALRGKYQVLEAPNGKAGLEIALEAVPDLIVSDWMMPEMDGLAFCKAVKGDRRLSHIPFVLLTAKGSSENQLEGLETGADAYLVKPFRHDILLAQLKNLVRRREQFREQFQQRIEVAPSEIQITPLDEQLINKAVQVVEQHLENPDFSVEDLSRELVMSRVYLYKKLMALTGKSPIEFIRVIRLKRAAQLLRKSQLTVAEVAYKVGFNNPKYFAKQFKEVYGMLPTAYQKSPPEVDN